MRIEAKLKYSWLGVPLNFIVDQALFTKDEWASTFERLNKQVMDACFPNLLLYILPIPICLALGIISGILKMPFLITGLILVCMVIFGIGGLAIYRIQYERSFERMESSVVKILTILNMQNAKGMHWALETGGGRGKQATIVAWDEEVAVLNSRVSFLQVRTQEMSESRVSFQNFSNMV